MQSLRETVKIYANLAKTDSSPFEDYGLGPMVESERQELIAKGKIKTINGIDVVALKLIGILRFSTGGYKTFEGKDEAIINFQLQDAKEMYKKQGKSVSETEILEVPVWDGRLKNDMEVPV